MKRKIKLKKKKLFFGGNLGGGSTGGNVMSSLSGIANMIPGWGSAVGGALDMVGGALNADDQAKKEQIASENAAKVAMNEQRNGAWKSTPVGGGMLAMGGDLLKEFNAPSHAQGGQAVDQQGNPTSGANAVAEVEKNETIAKDYAFSPNLFDGKSGMTFADASKKVEKKYKKRVENGDDISRRTRDKEMDSLKLRNDEARAMAEQQQMAQGAQLAQLLGNIPQAANGGVYHKANGGPIKDPYGFGNGQTITPNTNRYGSGNFDDMYGAFSSNDRELQTAMKAWQEKSGNTYDMGKVDGQAGNMTKGFFDDPIRRAGLSSMLKQQDAKNKSLSFGNQGDLPYSNHPGQVNPPTQSQTVGTPDSGVATAGNVDALKYLSDEGIDPYELQNIIGETGKPNNLIDKSGNIVPLAEQRRNRAAAAEALANGDPASAEGADKENRFASFMADLAAGKHDSLIGTAAKATEMIGQGIMAFRPDDKIDTEYNLRAKEAEETVSKIGTSLAKARQDNTRGLEGQVLNSQNAQSNAVKMALNNKAWSNYVSQGVGIAAKEKSLENQVAGTLGAMQSRHGTEDKNSRNMQEVKESQTKAVGADAKKTYFESIGNMGEFFSKKGAAQKKSQEQLMLLGQKYTNFTATDLRSYNKAIKNGNVDGIVKFVKGNDVSIESALDDASELGMTKAQIAKLKKKLEKDGGK